MISNDNEPKYQDRFHYLKSETLKTINVLKKSEN